MEVNLSKNRICDIHKTAFDAVKHSVQTLNLGHNCLQKVLLCFTGLPAGYH